MKLLVGLGNPGADYAATRHNIGFMALDRLQEDSAASGWEKKFHGLLATTTLAGEKLLLLKPQTYMNLSGQSVLAAAQFYKIPPADILVFHDELELPPGKIRIKQGGGAAGHNGIKSIDAALGTAYCRIRLGIGRPAPGRESVHDYVLHDFSATDALWLSPLLEAVTKAMPLLLAGNYGEVMNRVTLALRDVLPEPAPQGEV